MPVPITHPDLHTSRAFAVAADLRVVIGKLRRKLREQIHPGKFTWSQMSVLGHLEREGPKTVTSLARVEGVRPQSMGATVSALEAAGFVTGVPDPSDGRQTMLSLTATCREWIAATRAAREDWLHRAIQQNLSLSEQDELARGIELLKRLVDA